jgi:hypothetical protein
MRRLSAAVFGAIAVVTAAAAVPSAFAQTDNRWPPKQYVSTNGNLRCVITAAAASCERIGGAPFANAPAGQSRAATVTPDGAFTWSDDQIGASTDPANPELPLGKATPYRFHGWTALVGPDGTRLTYIKSTRGMLISVDGGTVTPY